jgi:shikimate dehydrogenase
MNDSTQTPDRYAVIGNPITHSRSPRIHTLFAAQTKQHLSYDRLLAPTDGFVACVEQFRREGGRGLNVTLPFKLQAHALASERTERAQAAGAANTLRFDGRDIFADNTDGVGLVTDISQRLGVELAGARLLLLGAGGAARGVLLPLLRAGVRHIHIANRTPTRAVEMVHQFEPQAPGRLSAGDLEHLPEHYELVINATAGGLSQQHLLIPTGALAQARLAYDMVYAAQPTPFMRMAAEAGSQAVSDGLGMLVEQAAESFLIWRGVRPQTASVYAAVRAEIDAAA